MCRTLALLKTLTHFATHELEDLCLDNVKWGDMCTHNENYFEYLLGNPEDQG